MAERARILLVDDEPSIIKMVSKRLGVEGYEVLVAMDGQEGLDKAQAERPDLVILDLMLPRLNGYEVCARLKEDPAWRKVPVLLFSAKVQPKDEALGKQCGADGYLRKPFQGQELMDRVRALLAATPTGEVNG